MDMTSTSGEWQNQTPAGEILERVIEHLVEAVTREDKLAELQAELPKVDVSEEACRRLLASLTRSLDQLRVKTLDAFFVSIAKVYALDLGLPPDWQIIDEVDEWRWSEGEWCLSKQHRTSELRKTHPHLWAQDGED